MRRICPYCKSGTAPNEYESPNVRFEIRKQERIVDICLLYPDVGTHPNTVEIDMEDNRATDSIRVNFDRDRNGWVIKQASVFSWDVDDKVCDEGWTKVAFVEAWALEEETEEKKQ